MAVWLVRAGRDGEREDVALEKGLAVIGWPRLPDLTGIRSRDELETLMRDAYPDTSSRFASGTPMIS